MTHAEYEAKEKTLVEALRLAIGAFRVCPDTEANAKALAYRAAAYELYDFHDNYEYLVTK